MFRFHVQKTSRNSGHLLVHVQHLFALCSIEAAVQVAPSGSRQRIHDLHMQEGAYLTEQVEAYLMYPNYEDPPPVMHMILSVYRQMSTDHFTSGDAATG